MSKSLVSIITPCFNGEKYIDRLLDSVLGQKHPNIEMFIVDDGSTDGSAEIIKSYVEKFKRRNYQLTYVYQQNQGQSVAINAALKMVKGDYLLWPDADDFYAHSDSISQMVKVLDSSDDSVSIVRVQYNILDENGGIIDHVGIRSETRYKTDLFEDCLFRYGDGFWGAAGGYLAKMKLIDQLIPQREIYTEKMAGQNWQICLPLLYQHKCLTIEKYLFNIVAHDDSHSRDAATNNDRQAMYYRTIKNTLDTMPLDLEYKKYIIKRVRNMVAKNKTPRRQGRPYRMYIKRAVKGIVPYGLMMLYKRRVH